MDRIVGLLPAGGRARRIHGFFKEMMPIGINELDRSKFVVTSERLIRDILEAGASSLHFILSSEKSFVAEYFAREDLFRGRINFNYLPKHVEDLGMPYTIDSIYEQTSEYDYILMGMPDTVIEPPGSFSAVLQLLKQKKADLALGLYRTDSRNRGGFIQHDPHSKNVLRHVDKTSPDFPADADNSWAIVCWNAQFNEFMHRHLVGKRRLLERTIGHRPEVLFGDVIDVAMTNSMHVVADYVDVESGFYWDITEPEKYFDLLRAYSPLDELVPANVPLDPHLDLLIASLRRLGQGATNTLITRRRTDRCAFRIEDEYDLQDVVEMLLRSLYEDVRHEEPTPSSGGSSSRMDFFVKTGRAAVEVKVAKSERAERRIKAELLVDRNDYRGHPTVNTLIAVVYDLADAFRNPIGFEKDLSGVHDGLDFRVVVVPWVGPRGNSPS